MVIREWLRNSVLNRAEDCVTGDRVHDTMGRRDQELQGLNGEQRLA